MKIDQGKKEIICILEELPFFKQNQLQSVKRLDFEDFSKLATLMSTGVRRTRIKNNQKFFSIFNASFRLSA
jgi:hypothetical protein